MTTTITTPAGPARKTVAAARFAQWFILMTTLMALGYMSRPAFAQTLTDTEKAIQRAANALEQEKGLAPETKAALRELLDALKAERKPVKPVPEAKPPGAMPLKMSGDFRLRHESSFKLDDQPSRDRERVRFRLGGTYQVNNQLSAGVRLATGARLDAQSPHVTLGEVFHKLEFNLDRAYLSYKLKSVPGLTLTGGKFGHSFFTNPVYGELVWDADVQPEGVALNYSRKGKGHIDKWDVTLGQYLLLEQVGDDARSVVAQAAVHGKLGKHWKPSLAVGYYHYNNLSPGGSQAIVGENSGNAIVGVAPALAYASQFSIVNPIASLRYEGGKRPIVVSAEYIKNRRAAIPQDSGWSLGAAIGSTKKKGDWRSYYQLQKVGQDAVLSAVSQDDFILQTNHRSHLLGANYQLRDNVGLHLWGLATQRDLLGASPTTDSKKLQWRLRLDTNVAF